MNEKTSIILHMPHGYENTRIVKQIDIDDGHICQIEVTKEQSPSYHDNSLCTNKLFFCFQDRQLVVFNPLDYAYIESTSNHYSRWHPINKAKPIQDIYISSLSSLLNKLHHAGLLLFWRVHSSYIINTECVTRYTNGKFFLRNQRKPIPVGDKYEDDINSKIIII